MMKPCEAMLDPCLPAGVLEDFDAVVRVPLPLAHLLLAHVGAARFYLLRFRADRAGVPAESTKGAR